MDTKKTEDMKFAKKKKKMSGKSRTFMLITIPIVALFFTFNTLPLIQGAIYSFTNFRGYGRYGLVFETILIFFMMPELVHPICLHLSWL